MTMPSSFCDAHVHLWEADNLPPWLASDAALAPIADTHDLDRLTKEAGEGLTSAVYLEVDVAPDDRRSEAERITKLCAAHTNPLRGAVIGAAIVDGSVTEFEAWVREWAANPYVVGVRQVLHIHPSGTVLREDVVEKARTCGEVGLVFELCMRCDEVCRTRDRADARATAPHVHSSPRTFHAAAGRRRDARFKGARHTTRGRSLRWPPSVRWRITRKAYDVAAGLEAARRLP